MNCKKKWDYFVHFSVWSFVPRIEYNFFNFICLSIEFSFILVSVTYAYWHHYRFLLIKSRPQRNTKQVIILHGLPCTISIATRSRNSFFLQTPKGIKEVQRIFHITTFETGCLLHLFKRFPGELHFRILIRRIGWMGGGSGRWDGYGGKDCGTAWIGHCLPIEHCGTWKDNAC